MPREAPLQRAGHGQAPSGQGWFVLNARDARWVTGVFGSFTRFEGDPPFDFIGVNIAVLEPGQPSCYYHAENEQEDFLVLAGECRLLIEGGERLLAAWDFVHCPPWTEHVFVGAGDGQCVLLGLGSRIGREVVYPASELARRHRASVTEETRDANLAYADLPPDVDAPYREGWLPDR
ncbi:MAG: cupin domain-containing protein [Solirubrobacterales bacterium]|nr:cupin domain-containing protein [Solirubrobacterales bacterium]